MEIDVISSYGFLEATSVEAGFKEFDQAGIEVS